MFTMYIFLSLVFEQTKRCGKQTVEANANCAGIWLLTEVLDKLKCWPDDG